MPEKISQILDLAKIDVFRETELNDNLYFNIEGLPKILSYGKHSFTLSYNDPGAPPVSPDDVIFHDSRKEVFIYLDIVKHYCLWQSAI